MKLTRLDKLILQGVVRNFNERMGPQAVHPRSKHPAGQLTRGQLTQAVDSISSPSAMCVHVWKLMGWPYLHSDAHGASLAGYACVVILLGTAQNGHQGVSHFGSRCKKGSSNRSGPPGLAQPAG